MNNIEKLQNIFQELRKDNEEGHGSAYELQWEDIETIENLIKENKKLKKYETYYKEMEEVNKKFIPKSKIKEKIEELERLQTINFLNLKQIDKISDKIYINISVRDILNQLLEEGE